MTRALSIITHYALSHASAHLLQIARTMVRAKAFAIARTIALAMVRAKPRAKKRAKGRATARALSITRYVVARPITRAKSR